MPAWYWVTGLVVFTVLLAAYLQDRYERSRHDSLWGEQEDGEDGCAND